MLLPYDLNIPFVLMLLRLILFLTTGDVSQGQPIARAAYVDNWFTEEILFGKGLSRSRRYLNLTICFDPCTGTTRTQW